MIKTPLRYLLPLLILAITPFATAHAEGPPPGVRVLQSDSSGLTVQLTQHDIALQADQVDGVACQRLSAPMQPLLMGAPPQARVVATLRPLATRPLTIDAPLCSELASGAAASGEVRVIDMGQMRSQHLVRLEVPLVQRDAAGNAILLTGAEVQIRFEGGRSGAMIVEPESFESMFRETLLNYQQARHFRIAAPMGSQKVNDSWTPPTPAWRIMVDKPGIYQLSYQDLRDAGLPVDALDPRTIKLFNFGKEVAITVTGEADSRLDQGDVLLFYGQGVDTRYTDVNSYWLTYGNGLGLRMNERMSQFYTNLAGAYVASVSNEENRFYVPSLPMEEGFDHWYGRRLDVYGAGNARYLDYTLALSDLANGAYQGELSVTLAGNVDAQHHLRLYVNGQQVKEDAWQGRTVYEQIVNFSQSYLHAGDNTIRIELTNDAAGQTIDQIYVDQIQLRYHRQLRAQDDILAFGSEQSGQWRYQVAGFTSPDLELYDISDPDHVARLTNWQAVNTGGGQYQLRFGDEASSPRTYWAQAQDQRNKPLAIQRKTAMRKPLSSVDNRADYLVIFHPDFGDAIKPLLDHRTAQGYQVMAVSTQEIYDEFGYGMMSAEAIRDFLAFAYAHWRRPAPSFVLLVGDGTYDMRHYLDTSADTFLPPYLAMVDPTMGETVSDNRFAAVAGADILPDLNIGRLPVNTPAEAAAMVDKILTYEQSSVDDAWAQNILFVADNLEGGGGNFYELSDAIADGYIDPPANTSKLIPEQYQRTKLYLDRTCASGADCNQRMKRVLNEQGALFVSFIGHGTKTFWARERIWDVTAASQMQNGRKLPVMLPMTCNEGYFIEPERGDQSTSEAGVRLAGNGAVASWAPTGYGLSAGHDYLERGFFLSVFHGFGQQLGPATTAGKLYLLANAPSESYLDLVDTFLLMGDPALTLPVSASTPDQQIFLPVVVKE